MYVKNRQRATSSEDYLGQALVQLLQDHSFPEVTVTMMCKRAGVSRNTFYRHFSNSYDVLQYVLHGLSEDILARSTGTPSISDYGFVLVLCESWREHAYELKALLKPETRAFVETRIRFDVLLACLPILHADVADHEFYEAYITNFLFFVLCWWAERNFADEPQAVAQRIMPFLERQLFPWPEGLG